MPVIVPDDLWRDVKKHYTRSARRLASFIETHPEQHECIEPTGTSLMKLGNLIRALSRANKAEKKTTTSHS